MNKIILIFTVMGIMSSCKKDPPAKPIVKPTDDSATAAFRNYLLADSGYWQFVEVWNVKYDPDTRLRLDSTQKAIYGPKALDMSMVKYYAFQFLNNIYEADPNELNLTVKYYGGKPPGQTGAGGTSYFDHLNKKIICTSESVKSAEPFYVYGQVKIESMAADHMWISCGGMDNNPQNDYDYYRHYYKLEKRK